MILMAMMMTTTETMTCRFHKLYDIYLCWVVISYWCFLFDHTILTRGLIIMGWLLLQSTRYAVVELKDHRHLTALISNKMMLH